MLKRRHRIQKIINITKKKAKAKQLRNHTVLKYKLDSQELKQQQNQLPEHQSSQIQQQSELQQPKWEDSDDQPIGMQKKNLLSKLNLGQQQISQKKYQGALKKFYQSKFQMKNWAEMGDGQYEQDIQDYLNEQLQQAANKSQKQQLNINFFSRSHQKHNSIVNGLDWKNNVLFSCGLDQKLKIWSLRVTQQNPELKMKLEKDMWIEKMPLTSCYNLNNNIYCGSMWRSLAIVDIEKWAISFHSSKYLNQHKNFQNFKANKNFSEINYGQPSFCLYSNNCLTLMDNDLGLISNLRTNQQIVDVAFGTEDHQIYALTEKSFYSWDLRTSRVDFMSKSHLGFTKLALNQSYMAIGSKLGTVYMYDKHKHLSTENFVPFKEVSNLITHITDLDIDKSNLILAMSKWKANAARVIDATKAKCVGNWPTNKTKLSFPMSCKINGNSSLMAIGSTNGYINAFTLQK